MPKNALFSKKSVKIDAALAASLQTPLAQAASNQDPSLTPTLFIIPTIKTCLVTVLCHTYT